MAQASEPGVLGAAPDALELAARAVDVALRDGSTVRVRPVATGDRPAIAAFLAALSPRSIAFRFFGSVDLTWAADWSTDVDYADRYALIATAGAEHTVIAHAAYIRDRAARAEVAFAVADDWQGLGIATIMLAHLAAAAESLGIDVFTAQVLPANHHMISVFRDSGFAVALRSGEGVIEVELPTSRSAHDARELRAARAASPRSRPSNAS